MAKRKVAELTAGDGTVESEDPAPPPVKVEKYRQSLKCHLSPEEVAERADRAAEKVAELGAKTADMKAAAKHAKSIIEAIEADLQHLSREVRSKSTYRDVPCERRIDFGAGTYSEVRLDTGEVMFERPMTGEEAKRSLPFPGDGEGEAA